MFDTINKHTDFYYNFMIGEYPENEEDYKATANLFDHLKDAGLTDTEMYSVINTVNPKDRLTFEDISDSIWDNSLLEKGKFYYHKELQIMSPVPTWDESFPFYLEMKIKYSEEDALNYFIKNSTVKKEWINKSKELGSIKYLLKEFKKFDFIESIDFFLHLIDYTVSCKSELSSVYDLMKYELDLAKFLEVDIANAEYSNKNKVVWRR